MAHVNDVQVNYGMTPDGRPFADLVFAVHFDAQDVQQNTHFGLYLGIFRNQGGNYGYPQQGFGPQFYGRGPWNGGWNQWQFQGNQGFRQQHLAWSSRETIAPNGSRSLMLNRRVLLNQQNDFRMFGQNQLMAQVWIMPDYQEASMGFPTFNGQRSSFDRSLPMSNSYGNYPMPYNQYGSYGNYPMPYNQYGNFGFGAPYQWNGWPSFQQGWNQWNNPQNWSYAGDFGYGNGFGQRYGNWNNGFGFGNSYGQGYGNWNNGFGYGQNGNYGNWNSGYNQAYGQGYGNGYGNDYGYNGYNGYGNEAFSGGFRDARTVASQPAETFSQPA